MHTYMHTFMHMRYIPHNHHLIKYLLDAMLQFLKQWLCDVVLV